MPIPAGKSRKWYSWGKIFRRSAPKIHPQKNFRRFAQENPRILPPDLGLRRLRGRKYPPKIFFTSGPAAPEGLKTPPKLFSRLGLRRLQVRVRKPKKVPGHFFWSGRKPKKVKKVPTFFGALRRDVVGTHQSAEQQRRTFCVAPLQTARKNKLRIKISCGRMKVAENWLRRRKFRGFQHPYNVIHVISRQNKIKLRE